MFVIVTKYKWYKWNRNTNKKLWKLKIIKYMKANKPLWNMVSIDFINVWEYEECFLWENVLQQECEKITCAKRWLDFVKKKIWRNKKEYCG